MANLVVCCDGTWNTFDQQDRGVPDQTNVALLWSTVAASDTKGNVQQKYYHPGVGTGGSGWDKFVGGSIGKGLDHNIMSAYEWLCEKYQPGDDIYLFGFSRGAYTVRSLAGLMAYAGLLDLHGLSDTDIWLRVGRVFQQGYRRKLENPEFWHTKLEWTFHANDDQGNIPIRFIGVWDTVGSLGIPEDMAILSLFDRFHDYTFHSTDLSPAVRAARHAIALDEVRGTFQPTLWTNYTDQQDVKQVWFAGAHSDVGGGYPETGLSHCTLAWMLQEAEACGLNFVHQLVEQLEPNSHGVLHDPCRGAFALLPTRPRTVPQLVHGSSIHRSVFERQAIPPINQSPYRPSRTLNQGETVQLDIFARKPWNTTDIWLEANRTYHFSATGEWLDSTIQCGPDGCRDGHFQLGEIAQMAGTVLGEAELLFKKLTGNQSADFRFTRRHEDIPWFALVGAIANGGNVDAKGYLQPHESFPIGIGCQYRPTRSGYLFAYANDAWNCYGNNRGNITLTVTG